MKKTVYLIVISVITIGVIIFGSTYRFRKVENFFDDMKTDAKAFFDDDWDDDDDAEDEEELFNDSDKSIDTVFESFSNLELDLKVAEVEIEEGEKFSLKAQYNRPSLKPLYKVDDGTLKIAQKKKSAKFGSSECRIRITVPRFTELEKLGVFINVGEVRIKDLNVDKLMIENNVGEINVSNVKFNKLDIENNIGEIDISSVNPLDEFSVELKTDIGEINFAQASHKKYSRKVDGDKYINVRTNIGEVSIH